MDRQAKHKDSQRNGEQGKTIDQSRNQSHATCGDQITKSQNPPNRGFPVSSSSIGSCGQHELDKQ